MVVAANDGHFEQLQQLSPSPSLHIQQTSAFQSHQQTTSADNTRNAKKWGNKGCLG